MLTLIHRFRLSSLVAAGCLFVATTGCDSGGDANVSTDLGVEMGDSNVTASAETPVAESPAIEKVGEAAAAAAGAAVDATKDAAAAVKDAATDAAVDVAKEVVKEAAKDAAADAAAGAVEAVKPNE